MTPEGIAALSLILVIVLTRLLFGRLFVNRQDSRRLHHTVKGYLLTAIGTVVTVGTIFGLRYADLDVQTLRVILLGVLLAAGGYYAFLEWRYIRESRRHLATLLTTAIAVIAVGVYLWMPIA